MAKLLHPDYCQDEQTRKLAEAHMKRVNAAFAILSDETRRRDYDLTLRQHSTLPVPIAARLPRLRWSWYAAAAGALLIGIAFTRPSPQPQPLAHNPAPPPPQVRPTVIRRPPPKPKVKASPEPKLAPRRAAIIPPTPPRIDPPRREFVPPPTVAPNAPTQLDAPPVINPPHAQMEAPRDTIAGTWVYIRPALDPPAANTYPPEFIELTVTEEGPRAKGRYNARYRLANLAISPDVRFTFEGERWKGNGGASGDLELVLLSPDRLRVSWVTTTPGSQPALGSGTAVLIRRRLP